jgi:ribosomal protein S18
MAFTKSDKSDAPVRRKGGMHRRKKVCVFCGKDNVIDYKDTAKLKKFVSESGKIFLEESQATALSTRESSHLQLRELVTWH